MKYSVTVRKAEYRDHTFEVEATSKEAAKDVAQTLARDYDFRDDSTLGSDDEAEYTTAILDLVTLEELEQSTADKIELLLNDICNANLHATADAIRDAVARLVAERLAQEQYKQRQLDARIAYLEELEEDRAAENKFNRD